MKVSTTRMQREISRVAFDLGKKLAQDTAAAMRRLGEPERDPLSVIATIAALSAELNKILPSEAGAVDVECSDIGARRWRLILGIFAQKILMKDKDVQQYTLVTNANAVEKAAQELANALSEQLKLPLIDLVELAQGPKPAKVKKAKTSNQPKLALMPGKGAGQAKAKASKSGSGAKPAKPAAQKK